MAIAVQPCRLYRQFETTSASSILKIVHRRLFSLEHVADSILICTSPVFVFSAVLSRILYASIPEHMASTAKGKFEMEHQTFGACIGEMEE